MSEQDFDFVSLSVGPKGNFRALFSPQLASQRPDDAVKSW